MMMIMMMPIYTLLNISYLYADDDARSMIPSRNTRSYTLRSEPSSPGRSFLFQYHYMKLIFRKMKHKIELENKYKQLVWIKVNFAAPRTAQRAAPQLTPSASFDLKPTSQLAHLQVRMCLTVVQ